LKKTVLLTFALVSLSTVLPLFVVGLLELQIAYASPYASIDVDTAYNMITNGSYPDLVVLDVRTQSEYDSGHVYGAVWIPHTELEARINELAGHENHEIIVYCKAGGRSATASGILDFYNFTKVHNMLGGMDAWQSAGYPVYIATVGVSVGDWFVYDYFIDGDLWLINDFPEDFIEGPDIIDFFQTWNTTDWERREVVAVSEDIITFNVTTCYINGTETNKIVDFNVTSSHDFWVIEAEMEAGEHIGTLDNQDPLYIIETMQWTYKEETRDTNTAKCWYELWGNRSMWWDKQTGVLVKEGFSFGIYNLETGDEFYVNAWQVLSDTNRWVVPEFPSGTAMLLVFVAVTVCVDLYRRRKLKGHIG